MLIVYLAFEESLEPVWVLAASEVLILVVGPREESAVSKEDVMKRREDGVWLVVLRA